MASDTSNYDLFISYAFEDKDTAAQLNAKLREKGLNPWFAGDQLQIGDSLTQTISAGLTESRFGVVILSKGYLTNYRWTMAEFSSLFAFQTARKEKVILPVWHNITYQEIIETLPIMADVVGISTDKGIDAVADAIDRAIKKDGSPASVSEVHNLSQAPKISKESIRQHLLAGEMEGAIEALLELTKGTRRENDAIVQSGRWRSLQRAYLEGRRNLADFEVEETRIRDGLLGLLPRIK